MTDYWGYTIQHIAKVKCFTINLLHIAYLNMKLGLILAPREMIFNKVPDP